MQNTTSKPVAAARKNGGGPKSGNKKKKQPEKTKSNGREAPVASGPRPVAPPPVSGPWGNPKPAAGSAPPPGFAASAIAPPTSGFSDAHQRLLRHRALFAFRFLVGKAVELTLASEERYGGVLDCVDPDDFSVVLKSAKRLSSSSSSTKPFEDGSTVIFKRQLLAHLVADGAVNYTENVFGPSGVAAGAGFRTDTEISGRQGEHLYGRELEVASSWLDPALDTGALEDAPNGRRHSKNQGKAGWNQFEANEKLFGVVSSYDENIYTTKLDKTKISTEQSRAAEKLAQEIERQSASGNFHLQEERGQTMRGNKHANDLDEEARYSSVDRRGTNTSSGGNAYVPPALRNPQHQPSGGKAQGKGPKAPPAASTATAPPPAPTPVVAAKAAPTPTDPVATPAPPKPLSFSEAVTGRSVTATTATSKASASAPKPQPEQKKAAASTQKAPVPAQVNGKDEKPAAAAPQSTSKAKVNSPTKKEAKSGKERKADTKTERTVEGKTENKMENKSSSQSTTTTTTTTTTTSTTTSPTKSNDETKAAASAKKALNPNAKEFKLSASATAFTPTFSTPPAAKGNVSSPYRGGSPGHVPYPHLGMGYPQPTQEEWMYDGNMEDGSEMGMPPYIQGGYGMPMMYPPMIPQQNMPMMRGQRGYGGYQQQGYNPRGGYYSPNGGYPGGGMPYPGGAGMPGGVGPQPPLPREPTPSGDESPSNPPVDGPPIPPMPEAAPEVESAPLSSKQQQSSSTSKSK